MIEIYYYYDNKLCFYLYKQYSGNWNFIFTVFYYLFVFMYDEKELVSKLKAEEIMIV